MLAATIFATWVGEMAADPAVRGAGGVGIALLIFQIIKTIIDMRKKPAPGPDQVPLPAPSPTPTPAPQPSPTPNKLDQILDRIAQTLDFLSKILPVVLPRSMATEESATSLKDRIESLELRLDNCWKMLNEAKQTLG